MLCDADEEREVDGSDDESTKRINLKGMLTYNVV